MNQQQRIYRSLERAKYILNKMKIPWSLTGGAAMHLYGRRYGVKTRVPVNINIVVNRHNMRNVYNRLAPRNARPISGNRNHYQLGIYDIIKANSRLAPNINNRQMIKGVPVVPLNKLLNQKYKTYRNNPRLNQVNKIKSNVVTIRRLLRAFNSNTSNRPYRSRYATRYS